MKFYPKLQQIEFDFDYISPEAIQLHKARVARFGPFLPFFVSRYKENSFDAHINDYRTEQVISARRTKTPTEENDFFDLGCLIVLAGCVVLLIIVSCFLVLL